jgi:hypothetical protein
MKANGGQSGFRAAIASRPEVGQCAGFAQHPGRFPPNYGVIVESDVILHLALELHQADLAVPSCP